MIFGRAFQILGPAYLLVSQCLAAATFSTGEDVASFVESMIEQNQVCVMSWAKRKYGYCNYRFQFVSNPILRTLPFPLLCGGLRHLETASPFARVAGLRIFQELLSALPPSQGPVV